MMKCLSLSALELAWYVIEGCDTKRGSLFAIHEPSDPERLIRFQ